MSGSARLNKTFKKMHDISGESINDIPKKNTINDSLLTFLDNDADSAYRRQWHRLERGLRLNRIRKFTNEEAEKLNLKEVEKNNLYSLLLKSLDKKQLNSKTAVIYDVEKESITEIKGLVMHRNSEGTVLFQLLDKQKGVTFRKKKLSISEDTTT